MLSAFERKKIKFERQRKSPLNKRMSGRERERQRQRERQMNRRSLSQGLDKVRDRERKKYI